MAMINPTLYPEVNSLLQALLTGVQTILGSKFTGMYLDGSLASGDFDQDSDIDFIVVTEDELSDDHFLALKAMHDRIAAMDSPFAIQLEGTYISRQGIRRYDPLHALDANIERGNGERLKKVHHDAAWVTHCYVLRDRGITLSGPAPQTLIDPVSPDNLRQAMLEVLDGWVTQMSLEPDQLKFRGYQSYIVLSLCRILYTLRYGTVVSKATAARWAQETLGETWVPLIERTWAGRHNPGLEASPEDVNGTMAFIRFFLERSRQDKFIK